MASWFRSLGGLRSGRVSSKTLRLPDGRTHTSSKKMRLYNVEDLKFVSSELDLSNDWSLFFISHERDELTLATCCFPSSKDDIHDPVAKLFYLFHLSKACVAQFVLLENPRDLANVKLINDVAVLNLNGTQSDPEDVDLSNAIFNSTETVDRLLSVLLSISQLTKQHATVTDQKGAIFDLEFDNLGLRLCQKFDANESESLQWSVVGEPQVKKSTVRVSLVHQGTVSTVLSSFHPTTKKLNQRPKRSSTYSRIARESGDVPENKSLELIFTLPDSQSAKRLAYQLSSTRSYVKRTSSQAFVHEQELGEQPGAISRFSKRFRDSYRHIGRSFGKKSRSAPKAGSHDVLVSDDALNPNTTEGTNQSASPSAPSSTSPVSEIPLGASSTYIAPTSLPHSQQPTDTSHVSTNRNLSPRTHSPEAIAPVDAGEAEFKLTEFDDVNTLVTTLLPSANAKLHTTSPAYGVSVESKLLSSISSTPAASVSSRSPVTTPVRSSSERTSPTPHAEVPKQDTVLLHNRASITVPVNRSTASPVNQSIITLPANQSITPPSANPSVTNPPPNQSAITLPAMGSTNVFTKDDANVLLSNCVIPRNDPPTPVSSTHCQLGVGTTFPDVGHRLLADVAKTAEKHSHEFSPVNGESKLSTPTEIGDLPLNLEPRLQTIPESKLNIVPPKAEGGVSGHFHADVDYNTVSLVNSILETKHEHLPEVPEEEPAVAPAPTTTVLTNSKTVTSEESSTAYSDTRPSSFTSFESRIKAPSADTRRPFSSGAEALARTPEFPSPYIPVQITPSASSGLPAPKVVASPRSIPDSPSLRRKSYVSSSPSPTSKIPAVSSITQPQNATTPSSQTVSSFGTASPPSPSALPRVGVPRPEASSVPTPRVNSTPMTVSDNSSVQVASGIRPPIVKVPGTTPEPPKRSFGQNGTHTATTNGAAPKSSGIIPPSQIKTKSEIPANTHIQKPSGIKPPSIGQPVNKPSSIPPPSAIPPPSQMRQPTVGNGAHSQATSKIPSASSGIPSPGIHIGIRPPSQVPKPL